MSLLSWFSRRQPADVAPPTSGLSRTEATRPLGRAEAQALGLAANRKSERLAHRERLYAVVRECMNRAGVLSSSYKFKVLSLDKRGRLFLVMIDLAGSADTKASALAEIEATIAQAAKARDDIVVKAVYWRQNEHVAVGLQASPVRPLAPDAVKPAAPHAVATPAASAPAKPSAPARSPFDPIDADEVAAFRQALAAGLQRPVRPEPEATQNYALLTGYEDTELPQEQRRPPSLSSSQYGDLR
jgi:hypothetical protein